MTLTHGLMESALRERKRRSCSRGRAVSATSSILENNSSFAAVANEGTLILESSHCGECTAKGWVFLWQQHVEPVSKGCK
ncbi:hypothetical protein K1719_034540 [Acacia pycnantha]|nr:hypothetical protein K1719_034540 [Acacia pycnantha]